ncbi:MAG TPA: tRNA 2-selenouridine(34) synthase MnmH [Chitinophagaceae bacterium]|nr:tRNA 2-selenouridine(34) synthase MnmH [Chitinophagaceae bacterium]
MAIEKVHIEQFLELAKQYPVIDVRSPVEYKHAHIPNAYSLPLFTDEERKVVGTTYKQQSREQAIKVGLDFFGPKMKLMVEKAEEIIGNRQQAINNPSNTESSLPIANCLLLYCWRGGMRSAGVAWLLDLYGFKVYTLVGGYKKFRNYVLDTFKIPFHFNILGGYTGSGKTGLLKALQQKGEGVIDLEGFANHKGSAFGNIGMPAQPTQEMFENLLATSLNDVGSQKSEVGGSLNSDLIPQTSGIWLEDESQRIGLVNIPNELWKNMRQSAVYFLDIPFEERLKHIVQEYGNLDQEKLIDAISRISQKLGNLNAKTAILLLKEGKITESFDILLKYYDKLYFKSLHNREGINSLLHTVECKSITPENTSLLALQFQHQYQTS